MTGKGYGEDMGKAEKVLCTHDSDLNKDFAIFWMWAKDDEDGEDISESPYQPIDDSSGYCAFKINITCGDDGTEPDLITDVHITPSTQTDFTCKQMLALGDSDAWNDFKDFAYKNLIREKLEVEKKDGKKYIKEVSFKQYLSSAGKVRSSNRRLLDEPKMKTEATATPKAKLAEPNSVVDVSADSSDGATQERKLWGTYSYWHNWGSNTWGGHTYKDGGYNWWSWNHWDDSDDFESTKEVPNTFPSHWHKDDEDFQCYKWIVDKSDDSNWDSSYERKFSVIFRWEKGDVDLSSTYKCRSDQDGKECNHDYDSVDKMHCDHDGYARIKVWSKLGEKKIEELWDPKRECGEDTSYGENLSEWYKELCHVVIKVKCDPSCLGDTRRLDQTYLASLPEPPDVDEEEAASICKYDLPIEDVRPIVVDQCRAEASTSPVSVFSKDGNTVTFTLSQVWKECNAAERYAVDWIAADYVATNGNLECHRMDSIGCGDFSMLTAKCTDGVAVIDLYASDSSEDSPFRQTDGSSLIVPEACSPEGDDRDACHFRYVIDCAPRCEDVMPKPKSALSSIKEAFTSGLFGRK